MDHDEAHRLLTAERARIEAALAAHAASRDGRQGAAYDEPDGNQAYAATVDAGLRGQLEDELKAVERAEQRLAEGRFGLSVESGDQIPDARLRVQPTAERTVDEQKRYAG